MAGASRSTRRPWPAIAREIGFTQVSVSHEVSPLMKIVGRGDTTVVDAYLSPILRAYVDRVAAAIGGTVRLMFMQSNGGLVDARRVPGQGRHPVGAGRRRRGRGRGPRSWPGDQRIIGFDMGGTSTDVAALSPASYERRSTARWRACGCGRR